MSNILNQAEVSTSLYQKKMRECPICKSAGFSEQLISKIWWKTSLPEKPSGGPLIKMVTNTSISAIYQILRRHTFLRKKVEDIAAVTDVREAKELLLQGWEYKTSYPATISNIPHFILIKRE